MDVNNTHFHVLMGAGDWQPRLDVPAGDAPLHWNQGRQSLTLSPRLYWFPAAAEAAHTRPVLGGGCDTRGNWYWLDPGTGAIVVRPVGGSGAAIFWPRGLDLADLPLRCGLAVTPYNYLVVGVPDEGLLVFDLEAGGEPDLIPMEPGFAPRDIAAGPDGSVWVLDAHGPRYWQVVARVEEEPSGDGWVTCTFQVGAPVPVPGPVPLALEVLADGTVLLLEPAASGRSAQLHWYRAAEPLGHAVLTWPTDLLDEDQPPTLLPQDLACAAGSDLSAGTVYLSLRGARQVVAFVWQRQHEQLSLELGTDFLPISAGADPALVVVADNLWCRVGDDWVQVEPELRRRYARTGTLETDLFDSRQRDCVWHRVLLDAAVPQGTAIWIESRAHNREDLLPDVPWRREPMPVLRPDGAELPYYRPFGERPGPRQGTYEVLLQAARGQHLQLRIHMQSTGSATARLQALRVWYPRFSYLDHYLPAVYRDDAASASFFERFLANPEGIFTALEGRIAEAQVLFDPRTVPAEYLPWLASWLGVSLRANWGERRRRLFLAHAVALFGQRGTLPGLVRALRLALEPYPTAEIFRADVGPYLGCSAPVSEAPWFQVIEGFTEPTAGAVSPAEAPWAHRFRVVVTPRPADAEAEQAAFLRRVAEVVDQEKPAHTEAVVSYRHDPFAVGAVRLGVEGSLRQSTPARFVLGSSSLNQGQLGGGDPDHA